MLCNTFLLTLQGGYLYEKIKENEYYEDWPYHNLDHATKTMITALNYADECEANGVSVDRFVLIASSLYHDANFYKPLDTTQYSSKEDCSAAVSTHDLRILEVKPDNIKHIADCIRSTERGVICQSPEAKILRKADLSNLAGPFGEMILSSYRLFQEICQEQGFTKGFIDFLSAAKENVHDYLDEDISLGDFDRLNSGRAMWLNGAERNFAILHAILLQPTKIAEQLLNKCVELAQKRDY